MYWCFGALRSPSLQLTLSAIARKLKATPGVSGLAALSRSHCHENAPHSAGPISRSGGRLPQFRSLAVSRAAIGQVRLGHRHGKWLCCMMTHSHFVSTNEGGHLKGAIRHLSAYLIEESLAHEM